MDNNLSDLGQMAGRLEMDLSSLLQTITDVPKCPCERNNHSECQQQTCAYDNACHVTIQQALHHIHYATTTSFERELKVLGIFMSPSACFSHQKKQGELSATIDGVIEQYTRSKNCLATISAINKIAGSVTDYASSIDLTLKRCLSSSELREVG
jgi:hypothetical protein